MEKQPADGSECLRLASAARVPPFASTRTYLSFDESRPLRRVPGAGARPSAADSSTTLRTVTEQARWTSRCAVDCAAKPAPRRRKPSPETVAELTLEPLRLFHGRRSRSSCTAWRRDVVGEIRGGQEDGTAPPVRNAPARSGPANLARHLHQPASVRDSREPSRRRCRRGIPGTRTRHARET